MDKAIFDLIVDILIIIVYLAATIMGYRILKKIYGGRFTSSIPYFMMGIVLIFGMVVLEQADLIFPALEGSDLFRHSIQTMQLVAGVFFISALYQMYQVRFATEGFMGREK